MYRVLCHNCNMALGFYGYCPHHPERSEQAVADPEDGGMLDVAGFDAAAPQIMADFVRT
jgi:hypothetical protein